MSSGGGGSGVGGAGGNLADIDPLAGIEAASEVPKGNFSFQFLEGPLWLAKEGVLLFSDIPANRIYKLTPPSALEIFREPSGKSNGLGWDQNGLLIACEHDNRRVSRTLGNGMVEVVIDSYQNQKLNSPNDVIVRNDGNLYFTDPPYGIPQGQQQELAFQGVFRIDPAGAASVVMMDMAKPNGIALSPDQNTLYVADSEQPGVRVLPLSGDGTPGQWTKLIDRTSDGMAIDDAGNLYLTNNAGVEVFRPDGSKWGSIALPATPTNASFGGPDRKTLYITLPKALYRVTTNIPGLP